MSISWTKKRNAIENEKIQNNIYVVSTVFFHTHQKTDIYES